MEQGYVNPILSNSIVQNLLDAKLAEHSRTTYAFTRSELEAMAEYDSLRILAQFYRYMDVKHKQLICDIVEKQYGLEDVVRLFETDMQSDELLYVPVSCKLIDRTAERNVAAFLFAALFEATKEAALDHWDKSNPFSNYLAVMNAAYFQALANLTHQRGKYMLLLQQHYSVKNYLSLVDKLLDDVDYSVLERMIEQTRDADMPAVTMEDCNHVVNEMERIRHKYAPKLPEMIAGLEYIKERTGIYPHMKKDIEGFECFFCMAKNQIDEYIIVYQRDTRLSQIIDDEQRWHDFQKSLYYAHIPDGMSSRMVYIIYILDGDSSNIPIQTIESNRTFGRKYVFTEEETVTFINGIVKTSSDETAAVSPVQEWDRILREVHLTGCLTEAYSAKKVSAYLDGQRFDADYISDEEYSAAAAGKIPKVKWVKSLDTSGFRDFCFDDAEMDFGQINLFFGSNGSGKTSVLEAIEYALTCDVRRVKDFKVKMPSTSYPTIKVYDTEAGVHSFNPAFSKKYAKEIERVWYGVPAGRTKTNLNDNFNRFNSFDSEAAYKFIHSADNDADGFATMFGNLMFGETVVGYEKKWQRFKKAFDDTYSELRETLSNARSMKVLYEQSLKSKKTAVHSEEIEKLLRLLALKGRTTLPSAQMERYSKLKEDLLLVRKYIEYLKKCAGEGVTFAAVDTHITESKSKSAKYQRDRKQKSDKIAELATETSELQRKIFDDRKAMQPINTRIENINTTISNWNIVQRILGNTETLALVNSLIEELEEIDRELLYISKIEQRTSLVRFLRSGNYDRMSTDEREDAEEQLAELKSRKRKLEQAYEEAKKAFGKKEQQTIELRKLGKTLLTDAQCPLCGQTFASTKELLQIIDSSVVVDSSIDRMISEIQKVTAEIKGLESELDREKLAERAMRELQMIAAAVPMVQECGDDFAKLLDYLMSKMAKETRKAEIVEQQLALSNQGYSVKNINACYEFKRSDPMYVDFLKLGTGTFAEYLERKLNAAKLELAKLELQISQYESKISDNKANEELLRGEIREIDIHLEALGVEAIRELEQAVTSIKLKFTIKTDADVTDWISKYQSLYDMTEMEVERIESESGIQFERQMLAEYTATIERETPRVERCAKAVHALERMPSLSSFVESGIRNNIQQISKFFRWMHHSGEFVELGIDDEGIYAIRGINDEKIRTYQMSTGQRSTIAMAVMFALHIAAPDAPQFLLLDEPLATMDDTQVLNVLDILKSMAEQNTQIFFTTANGVMINLFKECFRGTDFDYREFQFTKRVNMPSTIDVSSVNSVRTIEELTLDDLTLDFHQFAQIREILRRNQEKLVDQSEWEQLPGSTGNPAEAPVPEVKAAPKNFYALLTDDERRILDILVVDQPENFSEFRKLVPPVPHYKTTVVRINEKAQEFFGETVINDDDDLPYIEEDYVDELKKQHDNRPATEKQSAAEQHRLGDELLKAEETARAEEKRRLELEENLRKAEQQRLAEEQKRRELEAELEKAEQEKARLEEARRKAEEQQRLEAERHEAEERRLREEEQRRVEGWKAAEELRRKAEEQQRIEAANQLAEERRKLEEAQLRAERSRLGGVITEVVKKRASEEEQQRAAEAQRKAEEQRRIEEEHRRAEEERRRLEEQKRLQEELRRAEEERVREEDRRKAEEQRRIEVEAQLRKAEEERRAEAERVKAQEQNQLKYRQMNRCQHCGGTFTGLFSKKCSVCGKPKDYK